MVYAEHALRLMRVGYLKIETRYDWSHDHAIVAEVQKAPDWLVGPWIGAWQVS